jgi:hypothetical protein
MAQRHLLLALATAMLAMTAQDNYTLENVRFGGSSATWIFANICYAGMRAQAHPSLFWSVVTFIGGFPGTFLTFFVVKRGGERAYGIDIPSKR